MFFALVLPIVLMPVAAFAIDSAVAADDFSRLEEVTARAAEEAAQQIDAATLRSGGGIVLDGAGAAAVARLVVEAAEPSARVISITVAGTQISVTTVEVVMVPLSFFGKPTLTLHARAVALLGAGYDRPSSLLPLPVSTF